MSLGERIFNLRKERGISQEELADALGVSRQTVSKWENGLMPVSADKQRELSEFFGVENFSSEAAAAEAGRIRFSASQKIVIAVIAVFFALSCAATAVVGCVSLPNLRADEKGATSLYVDTGYFWLSLGITLIIAGIEVFAIFAYGKENSKKSATN